jgi:hypothetical protein
MVKELTGALVMAMAEDIPALPPPIQRGEKRCGLSSGSYPNRKSRD